MSNEGSLSETLSYISKPAGHLDTSSPRYKKLTEFRGWSYFVFACFALAILLAPVAVYQKTQSDDSTLYISITYWAVTKTVTDSDGSSESRSMKTADGPCATEKERFTAAAALSIMALIFITFASFFALMTSGRLELSMFKPHMVSITYYTPFIVVATWGCFLVSWALMVAYVNNTDWCTEGNQKTKSLLSLGYVIGPGLGLNIAAWALLTVLEVVHVYLVHTRWVPRASTGDDDSSATEAMITMSPVNKSYEMPPHALHAIAANAPFVYHLPPSTAVAQGQQPVYVIYQPAGMAPPPGYVPAQNNQLPPGLVPLPTPISTTQQVVQPHYYLPVPQQQPVVAVQATATSPTTEAENPTPPTYESY